MIINGKILLLMLFLFTPLFQVTCFTYNKWKEKKKTNDLLWFIGLSALVILFFYNVVTHLNMLGAFLLNMWKIFISIFI